MQQSDFDLWLAADPTNEHSYIEDRYMCLQYADDLIKNATAAGFTLRLVLVDPYPPLGDYIADGVGHYIVLVTFPTYVRFYDPRTDKDVSSELLLDGIVEHMLVFSDYMLIEDNFTYIRYHEGDYATGEL